MTDLHEVAAVRICMARRSLSAESWQMGQHAGPSESMLKE